MNKITPHFEEPIQDPALENHRTKRYSKKTSHQDKRAFMKKSVVTTGLIALLTSTFNYASPILSIIPSTTSMSLRNDASIVVSYQVKNNTTHPIDQLSIKPNYQTTGVSAAITLGLTNTCTPLLPGKGSCQFDVVINGANQPAVFQVTPEVCGYAGLFCSMPDSANYLTIRTSIVSTPNAYFSVQSGSNTNTIVPVNTNNLQTGTPFSLSPPYSVENPITVSPDGTRIYAAQNNSNVITLLILKSGSTPALLQTVDLGYLPYLDEIVVSPDGRSIYVSGSEAQTIQRIDKTGDVYTPTIINMPVGKDVSGLAISPDNQVIFITSYDRNEFYVMNANTNSVIQTLTNIGTSCEFSAPGTVVVTPNSRKIYVANGFGSEGISVIEKNISGTYSCGPRITNPDEQLAGMVLSADGRYLYAIGINAPAQLYVIDTTSNTQIAAYTIPVGSNGIAITPDAGKLFISNNASTVSYVFSLANGLPSGSIVPIEIGGGSQTYGQFLG